MMQIKYVVSIVEAAAAGALQSHSGEPGIFNSIFFVLRIGDSEAQTSTKQNCSKAIWNENFEFTMSHMATQKGQNLEIFGYDDQRGTKCLVGKASIQLSSSVFQGWTQLWDGNGQSSATVRVQVLCMDEFGGVFYPGKQQSINCFTAFTKEINRLCSC